MSSQKMKTNENIDDENEKPGTQYLKLDTHQTTNHTQ